MNPYLQIFLTIFSGVCVVVAGQIIIKFIIEPIHEIRKLLSEISDDLIYFSDLYSNPGIAKKELMTEAKNKLRINASKLKTYSTVIFLYNINRLIFRLPRKVKIKPASQELIRLSNSIFQGDPLHNSETADKIRTLLGFPIEE